MKYLASNKEWNCAICNYNINKFNRLQVLGHINSKHPDNINNDDEFTDKMHLGENMTKWMTTLAHIKNF